MHFRRSARGLVFFFFCLIPSLGAQVELERVSDSIYVCEDHFYARENSLVVIGADAVTVIGATWTPTTAKALHERIAEITDKPVREVVNTNYHPDRAGGNGYWKKLGCSIHATRRTAARMESDWTEICEWTQRSFPGFPTLPCVLPTEVHDGDFDLQDGCIRVFHLGPSHTDDGVFVYLPKAKLLFGGCILKPFLGNLEHANLAEYPRTLLKLKELHLAIDTIVAGHGSSLHGAELIDTYLKLLEAHD